ncbi:MAG: NUDIX hydrolase [Chloroflexi bacterium]|nr:NUDIX hydrolase [Chloroflexota bacterium]
MGEERTVSSQRIYQGRVLSLRVDTVALQKQGATVQAKREVLEHGASVAVVPVDAQGRVILVQQYRKAPEQVLLEVPAGGLEPGEEPDAAALRELQEETGLTARRVTRMGGFWIAPGWCTEYMHTYLATGLKPGALEQEEDEDIQTVVVPLQGVEHLIKSGETQDAKSIAALLMALHLYPELLKPDNPGEGTAQ